MYMDHAHGAMHQNSHAIEKSPRVSKVKSLCTREFAVTADRKRTAVLSCSASPAWRVCLTTSVGGVAIRLGSSHHALALSGHTSTSMVQCLRLQVFLLAVGLSLVVEQTGSTGGKNLDMSKGPFAETIHSSCWPSPPLARPPIGHPTHVS